MGNLITSNNSATELIKTGQNNPKGLIGAIAVGVIAVGGLAIKAISDMK